MSAPIDVNFGGADEVNEADADALAAGLLR